MDSKSQDYFEAKPFSNVENFIIATQKLQAYAQYLFRCLIREIALQASLESIFGVGSSET